MFLALTLFLAQNIAAASEALVGKPAPPVSLELVSGKHFDLADQKGKVVFLVFWATWCAPCRREIPRLMAVEANNKDVALVGVSSELRTVVADFIKDQRFVYFTSAIDTDEVVSKRYGVDLLPRLFVINQQGVVVKMMRGMPGELTLDRVLKSLLR